jgi:hypothetical protein
MAGISPPEESKFLWVIERGELKEDIKLGEILKRMGPGDVYIKTGNALDVEGNVGVLVASVVGGTIGRTYATCMAKGIPIIIPIGLEKLIPIPITKAAEAAGIRRIDYSMGVPCGLFPIRGIVITEIEAIKILTGADAIPIASGGVSGAEGAVVFIISGDKEAVIRSVEIIESIKGVKLPEVIKNDCTICTHPACPYKGIGLKTIREFMKLSRKSES